MHHVNQLLWRKIRLIAWLTLLLLLGSAGDTKRTITTSIIINYTMPSVIILAYIITLNNRKFTP